MPMFSFYPPPPFVLASDCALSGTTGAVTAGAAYFIGVVLNAPVTVTQMRTTLSGTPTGNIDMGIYDASGTNRKPGNLLGHTGAYTAASGVFTKSLTANLSLSPGQYWLALVDTVADSIQFRATNGAGMGAIYKTTATNLTTLPSTAGTVAPDSNCIAIEALLSSGFA